MKIRFSALLRLTALLLCLALITSCGAAAGDPTEHPGPYQEFQVYSVFQVGGVLHASPDPDSPVLTQVPASVPLPVFEEQDGWKRCALGSYIGWLAPDEMLNNYGYTYPVPDFLPAELQLLYLKALSFYESYSPHVPGTLGARGFADITQLVDLPNRGGCAPQLVYPTMEETREAMKGIFSPQLIHEMLDSPEASWWVEDNGKLYSTIGGGPCWQADFDGFVLTESSRKNIQFSIRLRFGENGSWTCVLPLELERTREGWRFSAFASPQDQRWIEAMGEGFDIWEAMGFLTEDVRDDEGNLVQQISTDPDGSRTVTDFLPDGRILKMEILDPSGLSLHREEYEYDPESTEQLFHSICTLDSALGQYTLSRYDSRTQARLSSQVSTLQGEPLRSSLFTYNEKNQLIRADDRDGMNQLVISTLYDYDADGNCILEVVQNKDGTEESRTESVYQDGLLIRKLGQNRNGSSSISDFNESGNCTQVRDFLDGVLLSTRTYHWGDFGMLVSEETIQHRPDGSAEQIHRSSYNENGNLVRTDHLDGEGNSQGWVLYLLDEYGQSAGIREYDASGKLVKEYAPGEAVG